MRTWWSRIAHEFRGLGAQGDLLKWQTRLLVKLSAASIPVSPSSSCTPCVTLGFYDGQVSPSVLDDGMQLTGIDSQFHALLLSFGQY